MMGYGFAPWGGLGMGLFGGVVMLVFLVAVVLLAVWAVRSVWPVRHQDERESALEILKRRYAAGEISQAEYEQARRALG